MPDCCLWLNRQRCCCRRQAPDTYIYLYNPTMGSSSSLCHCLLCILLGFCLTLVVILTAAGIYHLNSKDFFFISEVNTNQSVSSIANKRQLQDFVNIKIDPCENFYEFVCDRWTRQKKLENYEDEDEYNQKWIRVRHRIHDKLMVNISNKNQSRSNENDFSKTTLSVYKLYQLCETQSPALLLDELERFFAHLIEQEPYRSHLTLFNRINSLNLTLSVPINFQYNPFFKIIHSSSHHYINQSFSTIIRINRRPLLSPIVILPNLIILNQTALSNLIKFDNDYTKFLQEANDTIKLYEQEYNQDSLIIKRILSFPDYNTCLPLLKTANGLQQLIELLNHFLQHRLHQFNTKLFDKQIRILDKITNNRTLVEHLRRIRNDFKDIEKSIPLDDQSVDHNSSCVINLLDQLLDTRMKIYELSSNINFFSQNITTEYFISNDWPYLMMLYDCLLRNTSIDTLVNYVFFDYYRHLIYPYYQPHIHRSIDLNIYYKNESHRYMSETSYLNVSCHINTCFDILHCYHPSLLIQSLNDKQQISFNSIKTIVQNIINRFRLIIEQSDHLYIKEKKLLINELNQIKLFIGHYSSSFYPFPDHNSSSYLEYVQLFSSLPYDYQEHLSSIEPIYDPLNHTLFLPYAFVYLSNQSIEYPLIKFVLKILSTTIQSNPFYIECSMKSADDFNSTIADLSDEHITYLLFRAKFLLEQKIVLDEYLWPFMSANSLIKRFLIDYTAKNYCQSLNTYQLFVNNTYLIDDVYLVFHCQQANTIQQSKCTVN